MAEETKPAPAPVTIQLRGIKEVHRHFYANSQKAMDYAKGEALRAIQETNPEKRAPIEAQAKAYVAESEVWDKASEILKTGMNRGIDELRRRYGEAPKFGPFDQDE